MSDARTFESRNMEIAIELGKFFEEHPEVEQSIPADATLLVLPDFDPELKAHNLGLGHALRHQGERVYFLHFKHLREIQHSRLDGFVVAEPEIDYGSRG